MKIFFPDNLPHRLSEEAHPDLQLNSNLDFAGFY